MNTLLALRENLRKCEKEYYNAQGSLESTTALIVAKAALKEARFLYSEAAIEFVEECIASDNPKFVDIRDEEWLNMEDVGKEVHK